MVVDVGTGDGKAVLRRARRQPATLFIGIDADAASMAEASRRAARPARRGATANALFLVAAAESLPAPLAGCADEVTVVLPWGSLLRGALTADAGIVGGLAGLLRAGGRLELMVSVDRADTAMGLPTLDHAVLSELADQYAAGGLECVELRPATAADVERLSSSWARRLGIPTRREAWILAFRRLQAGPGPVRQGPAASQSGAGAGGV